MLQNFFGAGGVTGAFSVDTVEDVGHGMDEYSLRGLGGFPRKLQRVRKIQKIG
jgi:hypothetical protein